MNGHVGSDPGGASPLSALDGGLTQAIIGHAGLGLRAPPRLARADVPGWLNIGLVNNMSKAAATRTEQQFGGILAAATPGARMLLHPFILPSLRDAGAGIASAGNRARSTAELPADNAGDDRIDALIVTGAEPRAADLREETFWDDLASLIDWARENAVPVVFSCLAAHAAVLHLDGIARHRLPRKRSGVFDHDVAPGHALTAGIGGAVAVPHSRWNELREDDLVACGYDVLSRSATAGVDMFARREQDATFLFFQGHPEYASDDLAREYRRDLRRFLTGAQPALPAIPHALFDAATEAALARLHARAEGERSEALLTELPELRLHGEADAWRPMATRIFANFLAQVQPGDAHAR